MCGLTSLLWRLVLLAVIVATGSAFGKVGLVVVFVAVGRVVFPCFQKRDGCWRASQSN